MISLKIKEYRKKNKLTQDELAARIGVNRATISKYESGSITPPVDQIVKISQELNAPLIDVLGIYPEGNTETDRELLTKEINELFALHGDFPVEKISSAYYFDEKGIRFNDDGINRLLQPNRKTPALTEANTGAINIDILVDALSKMGYLAEGEDLADDDFRFLMSLGTALCSWFEGRNNQ